MEIGELLSLTGLIKNIKIDKDEIIIGRDSTKCDIVIPRQHISGIHCKLSMIKQDIHQNLSPSLSKSILSPSSSSSTITSSFDISSSYHIFLSDLSSNGTYVNGVLIGKNKKTKLKNGDEISLTPAPKELDSKTHENIDHVAFVFRDKFESEKQKKIVISETNENDVLQEIDFISKIGSGAYGVVFLGINKRTNEAIAIKTIDKLEFLRKAGTKMTPEAIKEAVDKGVYEEVRIMSQLRHPHIVGVFNVFDTPKHVIIALDYCKGGDLESLIAKRKIFTELDSRALYFQILQGLAYLHHKNVIHRDLKPGNILIKERVDGSRLPLLKITDFGLSRILDKRNGRCHTLAGTPLFIAPEIITRNLPSNSKGANLSISRVDTVLLEDAALGYNTRVDMWSAGVILFLLISGSFPFSLKSGTFLENEIINCAQSSSEIIQNIHASLQCKDHLNNLLTIAPKRMTANDALNHPFITDITLAQNNIELQKKLAREPTVNLKTSALFSSANVIVDNNCTNTDIEENNEESLENYKMSMDSSSASKRLRE